MQAKPVVDGIEADVDARALVLRVDLLSDAGRTIASRYGVEYTPTFVVFDRGNVVDVFRAVDRSVGARLLALAR
jgi:peroxiredoxin